MITERNTQCLREYTYLIQCTVDNAQVNNQPQHNKRRRKYEAGIDLWNKGNAEHEPGMK
jgi:hypothetical protein